MLIGNNDYKLLYLDTNALRAIVGNENGCGKGFFEKFFGKETKYVPCFSYANVCELRSKKEIYQNFIEFFSQISCLMFYHYRMLIQEEYKAYKENRDVVFSKEVMGVFVPKEFKQGHEFDVFINTMANCLEDLLNQEKKDLSLIVDDWENKRDEFEKLGITKDKTREDLFLACEMPTVIKDLDYEKVILRKQNDYIYFPTVRMLEYSLFQRAQITKKPIKNNDVMDCMISAFTPYVDAIITEGFQANVCKKAKKHIPEMNNLEIYTLKDINREVGKK